MREVGSGRDAQAVVLQMAQSWRRGKLRLSQSLNVLSIFWKAVCRWLSPSCHFCFCGCLESVLKGCIDLRTFWKEEHQVWAHTCPAIPSWPELRWKERLSLKSLLKLAPLFTLGSLYPQTKTPTL